MNGSQTGPLEGPVVGSRRIGTGLRSRPENHRAASPIKPRARRKLRPVVLLPKNSLECSSKVSSKATRMPRLLRSSSAYLSHTCHSLHGKKTAVIFLPLGPQAHVAHPKPELWLPTVRFPSSPPNGPTSPSAYKLRRPWMPFSRERPLVERLC